MKRRNVAIMVTAVMALAQAAMVIPAQAAEPQTLTIWAMDDSSVNCVKAAAEIYNVENPDVVVEVVNMSSADIDVQIATAGAAGDFSTLPDIVHCQDYNFEKFVKNYPGIFQDLTDTGIAFDEFGAAKIGNSVIDGRNYGVPFDNGACIGTYRTDILKDAGYTLDDLTDITWNEFITIGEDVLEKTGYPMVSAVASEPQVVSMMLVSAGSSFFNEDGTVNAVGNDVLKEAIRVYTEMVQKGIILEVADWEQYYDSFGSTKVVGCINGCWISGAIREYPEQSGLWGITNIPRLEVKGGTNYSNNGGSSYAVVDNGSGNVELAIDFLDKTLAGSTELCEKAIQLGNMLCYKPAADLAVYKETDEFFGNDVIYAKFLEYSNKVPSVKMGAAYYDGIIAAGVATSNIIQSGADIDTEIQGIQDTLEFNLGL